MNELEEHEGADAAGDAAPDDSGPGDAGTDGTGAAREGGARRRRRRRRGRGRGGADAAADAASPSDPNAAAPSAPELRSPQPAVPSRPAAPSRPPSHRDVAPAPRPPSRDAAAFASLTAGLFSHLDDRQVPCKVEGCARTWTWTAAEQIESFGQPPPKRMCAEHHAAMHTIEDREVRCSNPWCQRTWTWTKSAQLGALGRPAARRSESGPEAPSRACDHCVREERELADAQIPCRVDGCSETWTWSRDAQIKHRAWLRHAKPLPDAGPGQGERRGKRRRRGRAQPGIDGPAPRMCESCRQRLATLVDRETTCKVHGCTRTVTIDRESQLRAWVAAGGAIAGEFALPKRMCEVCREFCRLHHDREVPCARADCDRTWTYKTGAQLQAFLAGRFEDPSRLCAACIASGHERPDETIEGVEVMPCIVPLCDGIWHYVLGMQIAASDDGDQPLDRMCNRCRTERGATARPLVEASRSEDPIAREGAHGEPSEDDAIDTEADDTEAIDTEAVDTATIEPEPDAGTPDDVELEPPSA